MEYYAAVKTNELCIYTTKWKNLIVGKLSEEARHKSRYYLIPFI